MKVLVVGLGSIAKKHINALRILDSKVVIYALRSSQASVHFMNIVDLYSFDEVKRENFDFAIISNPTSEHKKTIEMLKELRIPLFIEKPLYHLLSIKETVESVINEGILTYMKKQNYGSIVNIASIYGIVGNDFTLYEEYGGTSPAAYSAIKGGIINFSRYLASYYGKDNIRINCVSPGGFLIISIHRL